VTPAGCGLKVPEVGASVDTKGLGVGVGVPVGGGGDRVSEGVGSAVLEGVAPAV
jgi:hypothetical protein